MTPRTPWEVLQHLLRTDAAAPRITFYERTPGPTSGERIELSGKVLVNWVSKAANLLVDELGFEEGMRLVVHLPAAHWRTAYWTLAAWSVGAVVVFVDADTRPELPPSPSVTDADALVTSMPADAFEGDIVVVTLAMLARRGENVPSAIDEARELGTFGDTFSPFQAPSPVEDALDLDGEVLTVAQIVEPATLQAGTRCYLASPTPDEVLHTLAADVGVVLVRGSVETGDLERILTQESVELS